MKMKKTKNSYDQKYVCFEIVLNNNLQDIYVFEYVYINMNQMICIKRYIKRNNEYYEM